MPQPQAGHSMKAYRNTGTPASPTWLEVAEIGDLSIPDLTRGKATLARRGHSHKKSIPTLIGEVTVQFRLHNGMDATNFDAIRAAMFDGSVEEWAFVDGPIATVGTQGLRIPVFVQDFPWEQNLEDVSGHDVVLAYAYWESPAGTEIDMSWMTVAV